MRTHRIIVDVSLVVLAISIIVGAVLGVDRWRRNLEERIAKVEATTVKPDLIVQPLQAVERKRDRR